MNGRFIAFEGGEGAGKSTQARMLAEALRELGLQVELTREPGGTSGAEAIRSLLLSGDGGDWGPAAEALLFAAARADHVEKLIRPAIEAGRWVICDRFIDSTRAYQGGGSGLSDRDIMELHRIGSGGLLPDLTILLGVSPEAASLRLELRDGGESDRIGGRDRDYHAKVARTFDQIAAAEPDRFVRLDGDGEPERIHQAIMARLRPLLETSP